MKNNFYTILPSNSCPRIHPDNKASKFIVEFQNPIYLEGQWEVAMLDFTFVYSEFPLYSKSKIEYETHTDHTREIFLTINNKEKTLKIINNVALEVIILNDVFLDITLVHYPYFLIFEKIEIANRFGFNKLSNKIDFKGYSILFREFKDNTSLENIQITVAYTVIDRQVIKFKDDLYILQVEELNKYFSENCQGAFKTFILKKDVLFNFTLQDKIKKITFDKTLSKTLGLDKQQYLLEEMTGTNFASIRKPKILKYHKQMFVYSSIVEPIIVGDVNVPLLKSIWLDKHENDEVVQIIIENPMYLPIAKSCINSIEINIRDDTGKLVNFANDSDTHLTLHFRKIID